MNNTQMMLMTAGVMPPLHSKYIEQVVEGNRISKPKKPYGHSGKVGDTLTCGYCKKPFVKVGSYQKFHPECSVKATVERARERHIRKIMARMKAR